MLYNVVNFNCYFDVIFERCVLGYLREYLVYIVIDLVPNCVVGGFRYVVRIMEEVLQVYSNLILEVYL